MNAPQFVGEPTAEQPAAVVQPRGGVLLANAPAATMATVYEAMAQALSTAMQDAVARQQRVGGTRSASVAAACAKLLALRPAVPSDGAPAAQVAAPEEPATGGSGEAPPHEAIVDEIARSAVTGEAPANVGELKMLRVAASQAGAAPPAAAGEPAPPDADGFARIIEACNFMQTAVMSPQVVMTSAAGKAHQVVAFAAALAVLDAVENLRNVGTIVTTAAGVALAHHIATGDPRPHDAVAFALRLADAARAQFAQTGAEAANVLKGFPAG